MQLRDLIRGMDVKTIKGNLDIEIEDIAYHSGKVHRGALFVAIRGFTTDGHRFIEEILDRGTAALVLESEDGTDYGVPLIVVPDSRTALAHLSAAFFGHPSRALEMVAVTGTNGKTTTSFLLESIWKKEDFACGVIGTINYRYGDKVIPAPMTTPESYDIQRMLREMLDAGMSHVVMEVSSHALDLRRVDGCHFDVGVFTNFTQDHLDYHPGLDEYRRCKERLFTEIVPATGKKGRTAVLNLDDPVGEDLWRRVAYSKMGYAVRSESSLRATHVKSTLNGLEARVRTPQGETRVRSALTGEFNIYNILAAMGAAMALGVPERSICEGIEAVSGIPGRMERIENDRGAEIFVDYAHTPDALERALTVLRPLCGKGRLITVFGCGGDRDRIKRPLMGRAAGRLSDLSIITSDNPRSEPPGAIIEEIEKGLIAENRRAIEREGLDQCTESGRYLKIEDRREAIGLAVQAARPGDIVLIAGKGHETYQILGDRKIPFDDRTEVRNALLRIPQHG